MHGVWNNVSQNSPCMLLRANLSAAIQKTTCTTCNAASAVISLAYFHVQHVRNQYTELTPILDALVQAYPQHLKAAWFTWEAYLWALQLWYAYAMKVCHHITVMSLSAAQAVHLMRHCHCCEN